MNPKELNARAHSFADMERGYNTALERITATLEDVRVYCGKVHPMPVSDVTMGQLELARKCIEADLAHVRRLSESAHRIADEASP